MLSHETISIPETLEKTAAMLLDYNGTLSDDEQILFEIIATISSEDFGIHLGSARYFSEFVGQTEEYIFSVLSTESSGSDADPEDMKMLLRKFNNAYLERVKKQSSISEEVRKFIREAKSRGKKIALVTAASREIVEVPLSDAGIHDLFDAIVCLEDVVQSKPKPDGYLLALELLGVEAPYGLAFEDSRTGIRAASAANLRSVAVVGSLSEEEAYELTPLVTKGLSTELFG